MAKPTLKVALLSCLVGVMTTLQAAESGRSLASLGAPQAADAARLVVYVPIESGRPKGGGRVLGVRINGEERAKIRNSMPFAVVDVPAGKHLLGINFGAQVGVRRVLDLAAGQLLYFRFERKLQSSGGYEAVTREEMVLSVVPAEEALADLEEWAAAGTRATGGAR